MAATILIVEDSDDDFIAIMRVFDKGGVRNPVRRCCCGEAALDCLLGGGDGIRPGLILLDLNLPGADGKAVLRAIRADDDLKDVPVIVLTSSFAREDINRCYDAGADSYLVKPVDMDGFIKAIKRLDKPFELDLAPAAT